MSPPFCVSEGLFGGLNSFVCRGPKDSLSKEFETLKKKHDSLAQQLQRAKEELLQKERDMALIVLEREQYAEEVKRKLKDKDDILGRAMNGGEQF